MKARISFATLAVIAVSLSSFAPLAYAYLDPSTGSMILSAIVGIFATVGLALKTYWYKLKSFFKGDKPKAAETPVAESAESVEKEAN